MKSLFIRKICVSFILCCTVLQGNAVENSIIPVMEQLENVETLKTQKYSKNQFEEIADALSHKSDKIRLMTYNMLFNIHDNKVDEVNRWPQRLPRIVELLHEMQPDVIGTQELYPDQVEDLLQYFGNEFAFYGEPCEDKENNGIFYRRDRFEVINSHVWFIPQAPSSESLTMVQLRDLQTGEKFAVLNTHMAFSKIDKRERQARFIAERAASIANEMPVIVTGDLNTFPNRPDLEKLPFLDGDYIYRILTQGPLRNAKEMSLVGHVGPISTFTNHPDDIKPFAGLGSPGIMLDGIFVSPKVTVLLHATQPGTVGGHFPSDHLPLVIDFVLDDGR